MVGMRVWLVLMVASIDRSAESTPVQLDCFPIDRPDRPARPNPRRCRGMAAGASSRPVG